MYLVSQYGTAQYMQLAYKTAHDIQCTIQQSNVLHLPCSALPYPALHCPACSVLPCQRPHYGLQEADEASVIADAKARLPSEPAKADPSACRIGQSPFLGCFLEFGLLLLHRLICLDTTEPCPLPLAQAGHLSLLVPCP